MLGSGKFSQNSAIKREFGHTVADAQVRGVKHIELRSNHHECFIASEATDALTGMCWMWLLQKLTSQAGFSPPERFCMRETISANSGQNPWRAGDDSRSRFPQQAAQSH